MPLYRRPSLLISHTEFTSNVTPAGTTEGTADTIVTAPAFNADGVSAYDIAFYCYSVLIGSSSSATFCLYDGASSIGKMGLYDPSGGAGGANIGVFLVRKVTPAAASKTYSIRCFRNSNPSTVVKAGAGGNAAFMPGYIRITRV